ncbi:YhcH/YjgK/YiaL family protein [Parapedobacter sp. 2B3]|uniref:YhcH/YjgK/YiaL family protein n=1 Tax=Parapedobacter sp. 2B3 TaxID=3342381 RepID=UPI0035B5D69F
MNKRWYYFMISMACLTGCTQNTPNENKNIGIEKLVSWDVMADESIDSIAFEKQYKLNPARWDSAFRFLREHDLSKLETGRYELDGSNLFVNIDEYETKHAKEVSYEAHRVYADIQYVVSGREKIGITHLDSLDLVTPYVAEKDIAFYRKNGQDRYRLADSTRFFIFFPSDAHKPCVDVDSTLHIRKAVVKIKLG